MQEKLVQGFAMSEDHASWFRSQDNRGCSAGAAAGLFVSGDFEAAVGAPNVFVVPRHEYGLPYPKVFLGTAVLPFCYGETCGLKRPSCFFTPFVEVVGFPLAVFMIEASLTFLVEDGCYGFIVVYGLTAPGARLQALSLAHYLEAWISVDCNSSQILPLPPYGKKSS